MELNFGLIAAGLLVLVAGIMLLLDRQEPKKQKPPK